MKSFICIKKCTYGDRLWDPIEKKVYHGDKKPNKHFMEVNLNNPSNLDDLDEQGLDPFNLIKTQIKDALLKLDVKNDEVWSTNGKPLMSVVCELLEFDVTRKQVEKAFPGFNRDSDIHLIIKKAPVIQD